MTDNDTEESLTKYMQELNTSAPGNVQNPF